MVEAMFRKLFNSAPVPLIVTDQKGTIKLVNEQADALLANKALPREGLSFWDFINHSFLKSYFRDKSCSSFEEFLELNKTQYDHWVENNDGTTIYADIKAATLELENEDFYLLTIDPIEITKKLAYELNERVKEQLCILNMIELCFKNQNVYTTLQLCLEPISEGWRFPEITEVRITLESGEEFATDRFRKTKWLLQSEIMTANKHYGCLEVCYLHNVPTYQGRIFLYEEERLIKVLARIIGTILEHWHSSKRINEAVVNAQEEERYHLAMELHDNVQQILTAASLSVALLENTSQDGQSKEAVYHLKTSLSEATKELRRLSQQLAPSVDSAFSLTEKVTSLTKSMGVNGRLKANINIDPGIALNEKIQLGFYRIIQEELTNIIKHAKTSEVEISIKAEEQNIILNIIDEGIGFDMSLQKEGIGFENIRRRTEFMNGSLNIVSAPNRGTRVTVKVPLVSG